MNTAGRQVGVVIWVVQEDGAGPGECHRELKGHGQVNREIRGVARLMLCDRLVSK